MSFSERLVLLLSQRRHSQAALAKAVGMAPSTVNEWTTGKAVPTLAKAIEVADFLGVPLDALVREGNVAGEPETEQQRTIRQMVETIGFDEALRRLMAAPNVKYLGDRPTYGDVAGEPSAPRIKRNP